MNAKGGVGEPWSSRYLAGAWLAEAARKSGSPFALNTVQVAAAAASTAAGPAARARQDHAFDEQDAETMLELRRLNAALRRLRGTEAQAQRWAKPDSLRDLMNTPARCAHWPLLRQVEHAVQSFEGAFLAARSGAQRERPRRGERASSTAAAASARYVAGFLAELLHRPGAPRELAITEIALGRARACTDADDFRERCKRWSKFTARRAA